MFLTRRRDQVDKLERPGLCFDRFATHSIMVLTIQSVARAIVYSIGVLLLTHTPAYDRAASGDLRVHSPAIDVDNRASAGLSCQALAGACFVVSQILLIRKTHTQEAPRVLTAHVKLILVGASIKRSSIGLSLGLDYGPDSTTTLLKLAS